MVEVGQLVLRGGQMAPEFAGQYCLLTFPKFRPLLLAGDEERAIAVGATHVGQPVGLALAQAGDGQREAVLLSVAVLPGYRRLGIATALLQSLEEELHKRGCLRIRGVYLGDLPSAAAVDRLLRKRGWQSPLLRMVVCRSDVPNFTKAPWMWSLHLPADYTFFSWHTLSGEERSWLLTQENQGLAYGTELSPFVEEDQLEPVNSVGLRYRGEIVGWQVTHRPLPDTIRYSRLFMRRDLCRLGRGIAVLAESIRRHCKSALAQEAPKGVFDIRVDNQSMLRFLERRLQPYLISSTLSYGVSKALLS
jgi:GNAT superfamily N-acetyltransferase